MAPGVRASMNRDCRSQHWTNALTKAFAGVSQDSRELSVLPDHTSHAYEQGVSKLPWRTVEKLESTVYNYRRADNGVGK